MTVSAEVKCKCGVFNGWVNENNYTEPCPGCGRIYTLKLIRGSFKLIEVKDSIFKKLFNKVRGK